MQYVSTRGGAKPKTFRDVALSGLAPDGGLYLPEAYPGIPMDRGSTFLEVARQQMAPFSPGIDLAGILNKAWRDFPADPAPLKKLDDNLSLLELFHGPSAAFKDFGLQFLGVLYGELAGKPLTVVGATSGDTGAAAVQALKNQPRIRLFMLHPKGKISELQRRQMTTVRAENIFNIAIEGSFDDCQNLLKQILAKGSYSTVNSINWGRILAQSVYYRWAANQLADLGPVKFVVPSGNFGNAFSGYVAMRTGAAIPGITVATNANDILPRTFETGTYKPGRAVATISPAMDIQVASNFERLLFEASGRVPETIVDYARKVRDQGFYRIPDKFLKTMTGFFSAGSATEGETRAAMQKGVEDFKVVMDPHTSVGLAVFEKLKTGFTGPVVLLATAHPAKFPETVPHAFLKSVPLPESLSSLMEAPEAVTTLKADLGDLVNFFKEKTNDS